jgi:hypothetical protein
VSAALGDPDRRVGQTERVHHHGHTFFATYDLFVVGGGLDLSGAVLLAAGLLTSPRKMVAGGLNAAAMGYSPETIHNNAVDHVDARSGVAVLVLGFALQALGYLIELGQMVHVPSGATEVVTALALTLVAIGMSIGAHFIARDWMVRRLVGRVALAYCDGSWDDGSTRMLLQVGRKAGWITAAEHPLAASDDLLFNQRLPVIQRVYGISIPSRPD